VILESVYISLDKRVRGACRCSVCSSNPDIAKWYLNDVLCKFDGQVCGSVDDLGVRVCFRKNRGHVVFCSRFDKSGLGKF
jgi:hypothetical protein